MGYRLKGPVRKELLALRVRLGQLCSHDLVKAQHIMQEITVLSRTPNGHSHGLVVPRACSVCMYFGHTEQHCVVRKERDVQTEIEEEARRRLVLYKEIHVYN